MASAGALGSLLCLVSFGAADVIDRLGEHLYDVEPIAGDSGIFECRTDGGEEGAAHVGRRPRRSEPPSAARKALNRATVSLPRPDVTKTNVEEGNFAASV